MSLTTDYLGLTLEKSDCALLLRRLSHTVDSIRRLEDAGASAVVMYSLFEEQITFDSFYLDHYLTTAQTATRNRSATFPK